MKCNCNMCNVDFGNDNGYEYVLDELKATREHIDNVIKIIEKRIEKDAIIEKVLNTDYQDDCEELKQDNEQNRTTLDDITEAIARRNAIHSWNTTLPYFSVYPPNILRRFPYKYY